MRKAASRRGWGRLRRVTLGIVLVTLLGTIGVANAATAEAAEPRGVLEIVTVPKIPGARFLVDGRPHSADRQGVVRLKVSRLDHHKVAVVDKQIPQGDKNFKFVRWYHRNHERDNLEQLSGLTVKSNLRIKAAFSASYLLEYSFVDKARNPVDRTRVSRVEFHGDHGHTVNGDGSGRLRLIGIRPVVIGGTIIAKKVTYTVQRVDVDGSNVVQVNAQRFMPSQKTKVVIPLLLHTVHFSTRDFLFSDPVGSAVWLKYPDGHRVRLPLDANGKATVERLARGSYTVEVDAPGLSFERPLALSRNQYVDLQHVSRLDIAVAIGTLSAFVISLYLIRVRGRSRILRSARINSSRILAVGRRP
jgi:hypothetical protein